MVSLIGPLVEAGLISLDLLDQVFCKNAVDLSVTKQYQAAFREWWNDSMNILAANRSLIDVDSLPWLKNIDEGDDNDSDKDEVCPLD